MEHVKKQVKRFFEDKIQELEYAIFQETQKSNIAEVERLLKAKILLEEGLAKLENIL